jgi:4-hydroxybenzoate polyprenyltransferase
MCVQTFLLFRLQPNTYFLWFVFFGTLCSYNFHWYFTPSNTSQGAKGQWSFNYKWVHGFLFLGSITGALYAALHLKEHWNWLALTSFITFLYSAPKIPGRPFNYLKRIAIGKTIFLAFTWTFVTAILPVIVCGDLNKPAAHIFAVNRFFLIYPVCILFDYRDRRQDAAEGIRSMVTHFDEQAINILFWGSLCAFAASAVLLLVYSMPVLFCAVLLLPALILAGLYSSTKKSISDYRYYFVLDGLMMLSGLLLLVISFT